MELLLVGLVALLVGALGGYVLSKLATGEHRRGKAMERELESAREHNRSYRREVSNHYVKTAQLVDELTESYRQLHNHLAHGSATLIEPRAGQPLMKTIPSREQIEAISKPLVPTVMAPPLDYAPKASARDKGVLDESFGLERTAPPTSGAGDLGDRCGEPYPLPKGGTAPHRS